MIPKTIIVYKSKTEFTKQYALWLQEELGADIVSYEQRHTAAFEQYDLLIFGSSARAGSVANIKWFKKLLLKYPKKNAIVFITGAMPASSSEAAQLLDRCFTADEKSRIKTYYFQSGICYEKMGTADQMLMKGFCSMLKKTQGESETFQMIRQSIDLSSRKYIKPMVQYILNG